MKKVCILAAVSVFFIVLGTCSELYGQGSLTPPGAPAPTMKTLEQIEPRTPITNVPYTITQPGSYYLTTNLTGQVGSNGIVVSASGVMIDLNGFELNGGTGSLAGITAPSECTNIIVRNGIVRKWGQRGLYLDNANEGAIENVHTADCGSDGLWAGDNTIIENCTAARNGGVGIRLGYGGQIRNSTAERNSNSGFSLVNGVISGCTAKNNTQNGVYLWTDCIAVHCTVFYNGAAGILGWYGNIIQECVARYNTQDGIEVGYKSLIKNNNCSDNGYLGDGAGINVVYDGNRVEGNTMTSNDRGLDVDVGGNFIICNSARDNTTEYDITGTQTIGPIVTDFGTITNQNPWANFEF